MSIEIGIDFKIRPGKGSGAEGINAKHGLQMSGRVHGI